MEEKVEILMSEFVTHDTKRFIVEKPSSYSFNPGDAVYLSINEEDFRESRHPFTFTSHPSDEVLEFIIKEYPVNEYPDHEGFTERLHELKPGDELILRDPFNTYEFEDDGVFLAGGAGITPFIAIFRDLMKNSDLEGNKLLFANKRKEDIILEKEFRNIFSAEELFFFLSEEKREGDYINGRISKEFLSECIDDFSQNFYVCGPPGFNTAVNNYLEDLGAEVDNISLG